MRWISLAVLTLSLPLLAGCGAISSLSAAGEELDAYTLSPAASASTAAAGRRHIVVETPSAPGALATDRILIKPLPYQAQYLPGSRWTEATPALVQTLLVSSFQNLGGFRLVSRTGAGLMPDYTLMTEVQEFQAEPVANANGPVTVKVSMQMTIIRESDRRIVASRRFAASEVVASDDVLVIVSGFDRVLQRLLAETVAWTAQQAG